MVLDTNLCSIPNLQFIERESDTTIVFNSDHPQEHQCYHLVRRSARSIRRRSTASANSGSSSSSHKNTYRVVLTDAYCREAVMGKLQTDSLTDSPFWSIKLFNPDCDVTIEENPKLIQTTQEFLFEDGRFVWKRDSPTFRSFTCSYKYAHRRTKDPPISIAFLKIPRWTSRSYPELTYLDYNTARIGVKDGKGLELSLLLSAKALLDSFDSREKSNNLESKTIPSSSSTPSLVHSLTSRSRRSSAASVRDIEDSSEDDEQSAQNDLQFHQLALDPQRAEKETLRFLEQERQRQETESHTAQVNLDRETEELLQKEQEFFQQERAHQAKLVEEETRRLINLEQTQEDIRRRRQAALVDEETRRLQSIYGDQSALIHSPPQLQPNLAPVHSSNMHSPPPQQNMAPESYPWPAHQPVQQSQVPPKPRKKKWWNLR